MIPKIIYYAWVSPAPLPAVFNRFIATWEREMPDYTICPISMSNVRRSPFVERGMEMGKYVLAGHYGRCERLYETGGLYFDIDVQVIKRFDPLLHRGCFIGMEDDIHSNNAVMGAEAGHPFMRRCLDYMDAIDMSDPEIERETSPLMVTKLMKGDDTLSVLPRRYFYPYLYTEQFSPACITPDTYAVHHWACTWRQPKVMDTILPE